MAGRVRPVPAVSARRQCADCRLHAQRRIWLSRRAGLGRAGSQLDPYVEFRHHINDGTIKSGDREKGFYSFGGALRYFGEDGIDTAHKDDMRDRIVQGPPFGADEREASLTYCEDDVRALARLVQHIVPTIGSLPHAMARCNFSGRRHSKSVAAFRSICHCLSERAPIGTTSARIW